MQPWIDRTISEFIYVVKKKKVIRAEESFPKESIFGGVLIRKQRARFYSGHFYPRGYLGAEPDQIASDPCLL